MLEMAHDSFSLTKPLDSLAVWTGLPRKASILVRFVIGSLA
jgi:hypothetical protein